MKTIIEHATAWNKERGYDCSEDGLVETIVECLSEYTVQTTTESEHRWYDRRSVVHQITIDGVARYFSIPDFHITGDNSARDMGLEVELSDIKEVYAKEITTTVYE
ncbi:hypothetical protein VPHK567_0241 [Vibrio phage K567]|nr:hypothetical protein MYOV011v1_p0383 [Vibrio phage 6E35.1a]